MARRRRPTLVAIGRNPTLHPAAFAIAQARFPEFGWHFFADSPDSSQALVLSAFLPVLEFPDRDVIVDAFVTAGLPHIPPDRARTWNVIPEYEDRCLLGESGRGEPTRIDVLLVAADAVVCVEAKFKVDARQGWGRCGQPPRYCEGFRGTGSDRKGTSAHCRLEAPDGDRGPRLYWQVGRQHFRPAVFAEQSAGEACPLFAQYQLVRNYLFAAEHARRNGLRHFGVLGVAPVARAGALESGVGRFRAEVLQPSLGPQVAVSTYESFVDILTAGSGEARELAQFLAACLGPRA